MKNKMMTIVIVVLVTVLLLGVVGFVVITKLGGNDNETAKVTEPSIEEITLASVDVPELTTNLMDGNFIRLSLKIQTNSEEAAAELLMREFQTKNIVIQTLSEMTAED
mgnify:FL=1